jgi:mannosyltransferase OCH1-like enzyme
LKSSLTDLVPILKADMLRYLLLFVEGGIYCDLDVSCQAPINQWIPQQYRDDASVVVGWEFDVGWGSHFIRQFATWTIMAKPGPPHVWMVIEDILHGLREAMREKDVPIERLTLEMVGDVVDATGPRRFTRSILKSVEETFNTTVQDIQELLEPKLVGDLLILPGYAFAASANKYGDGVAVPSPLVTHHYAGSWKNKHGGEMS